MQQLAKKKEKRKKTHFDAVGWILLCSAALKTAAQIVCSLHGAACQGLQITWQCREASPTRAQVSSSCAARAGAMVGPVPPGNCSGFPQWGSGGAPVANCPATGRSLGTRDHRIDRAAVSGGGRPADSGLANHRSCQEEPLKPFVN